MEMNRSSPSLVGLDSNAPTKLTADACIIHRMYSSRGEVYGPQESARSNLSDQSNSGLSDETTPEDVPIESGIDDGRNDLGSGCVKSSCGDISFQVSSSSPRELQTGTFHLHVYLEKSSEYSETYTHASIKANHLPSKSIHREQDFVAIMLALGEEKVLLCRDYAKDQRPRITIRDDHRGVVNVSFTWHRATPERT
jgi:hypothetical protein